MKHIVQTKNVAHLWAHQTQDSAKNAQGNFYFGGGTIYSYGYHFPIARHAVNSKGDKAILFTTDSRSTTTAKHISIVRRSIPDSMLVIPTASVASSPDVKSILDDMQKTIDETMLKAKKSTKYTESYLTGVNNQGELFNKVAKFFGSRRLPKIPSDDLLTKKINEQKIATIKARAEQQRKEISRRLEHAQDVEAWKNGESVNIPWGILKTDIMRIEDDEIVTSRSARVPLAHVKRIVPRILALLDAGQTYQRNGYTLHVGEYAIESLNAEGLLTVGCHRFAKEEIRRIAELLDGCIEPSSSAFTV